MSRDDGKLGVILLAILIVVSLLVPLSTTQFVISDNDPSTYAIIPMLMLPLFALFFAKKKITPRVGRSDIAAGALLFIALVLLTAYLRYELSYEFSSFKMDMLLFPLLLSSFIILIFGRVNLKRFWPLLLYSVFASPLILVPVLGLNSWFAIANTQVVYSMISTFVPGAVYSAPITIIANGYRVGIGESCVGIGMLVAVVLLLIPVAYFYSGKLSRRILWIASGLALVFLLNLLRMFIIAHSWITAGPTSAISIFHSFAGILMFYMAVIAMLLLAPLYGIGVGKLPRKQPSARRDNAAYSRISVIISIILAAAYLALGTSAAGSAYVSPYWLITQQPAQGVPVLTGIANRLANTTYLFGMEVNGSSSYIYMDLYNKTNTSVTINEPILLYATYSNVSGLATAFGSGSSVGHLLFISGRGIEEEVYYVMSNNTPFIFYKSAVPYYTNSSYSIVTFYAIVPAADMASASCTPDYNAAYTDILNGLGLRFYNSTVTKDIVTGECVIGGAVSDSI